MTFSEHLASESVLLDPRAKDKWDLLGQMVRALQASGQLPAERSEEAKAALEARERSKSTGMDQGVAVPHAALEGLEELAAGLAVLPRGIEFDSLDGRPAQFVVLLLVPQEERILHVRTLAEVARRLGEEDFRKQLLTAREPAEVVRLWAAGG